METIEMKALRIKNILNSLEEKIESGNITIREAAWFELIKERYE